jgi:hypothetical protein
MTGFDVVYGAPRKLPQGFLRNLLTANIKRLLARVMDVPSVRNISAFRMFHTKLRDSFANFQSPTLTLDVLLSWGTTRFTYVLVDIPPADTSNYNFSALVRAAFLILTGYSTLPLRLASWVGFGMTCSGSEFLFMCWLFIFCMAACRAFPSLPPSFRCLAARSCSRSAFSANIWRVSLTAAWIDPLTWWMN